MAMEEIDEFDVDWSLDPDWLDVEWSSDLDTEEQADPESSRRLEGGCVDRSSGGCVDRDCLNELRLSPVFHVLKDAAEATILGLKACSNEKSGSPLKNLLGFSDAATEAARCTGGGVASYENMPGSAFYSVFTVVPLSPRTVVSADHAKYVIESSQLLAMDYCMTLNAPVGQPPWEPENISYGDLFKPVVVSPRGDHLMVDPTSGTRFAALPDFNFWKLAERGSGKHPRSNYISRFEHFMFPASMSFFQTRTCVMVMYPDVSSLFWSFNKVDELHKELQREKERTSEPTPAKVSLIKDIESFANKLWEKNGGMMLRELESSELPETRADQWKLKNRLLKGIYELLRRTWESGNTGDCFAGVGRILSYNRTAIAHTVSTLPGASGAALVPTGVKFRRVFCGIQSGPAEKACTALFDRAPFQVSLPDHNVALSCDHPFFVTQYWKHIVDELPPPSKFSSSRDAEEVVAPFLHWIGLHLRLIVSSVENGEWSDPQKRWLAKGVDYLLNHAWAEPDFRKLVIKLGETPGILQHLGELGYPEETKEQISFLQSAVWFSIKLDAWNMPGVTCKSGTELARIATALFSDLLSEEQHYLGVPLLEFNKCRLVQSGIELGETGVDVVVRALAQGFRSLFISTECCAEEVIGDALQKSPTKREHIQILVGGWTTKDELQKLVDTTRCEYVDVLIVKLSDLHASTAELQAVVDSQLVRCIGLRTDSAREVLQALKLFQLGVVQVVNVAIDIVNQCEALNIAVISSELWDMNADDDTDATPAQLNVAWKIKNRIVPFTLIQRGEELSKLHEVATQPFRFSLLIS